MNYLFLAFSGMLATGIYMAVHKRKSRPKCGCMQILGNCWGDVGGSSSSSDTSSSSTTSNQYTDEQKAALKNILSSSSGVTSTLGTGIEQLLSSALQGDLTASSQSQLRSGKESNAATAKAQATQASEALGGKGMLNSGATNKVMSQIQTNESKANQDLYNQIINNQDANLYKTLASALGLTSLAGGLSTAAQGSSTSGTSSTSGYGVNASADLGSALATVLLMCWVAKEVFGSWEHPRTIEARFYIKNYSPLWFRRLYRKYGEKFANYIHNKPIFKIALRPLFEYFAYRGRLLMTAGMEVA